MSVFDLNLGDLAACADGAAAFCGIDRQTAVAVVCAAGAAWLAVKLAVRAGSSGARLAGWGARAAGRLWRGRPDPLLAAVLAALDDARAELGEKHFAAGEKRPVVCQEVFAGGVLAGVRWDRKKGRGVELLSLATDGGEGRDLLGDLSAREKKTVLHAANGAAARARARDRAAGRAQALEEMTMSRLPGAGEAYFIPDGHDGEDCETGACSPEALRPCGSPAHWDRPQSS